MIKPGDTAIYTNPFGICQGVVRIIAEGSRLRLRILFYEGSDTPWYGPDESCFRPLEPGDLLLSAEGLQDKYGWAMTREDERSLLMEDLFEGEWQ